MAMAAMAASIRAATARPLNRTAHTSASTSSMYRPEPITQFQAGTVPTYCSLATGSVLPGRGNFIATNALPSALFFAPSSSTAMMSMPFGSMILPSMFWPVHSGLNGCITPTPSLRQMKK